ncbi:hypothetical protein [Halopiger goleimassiliensis]|uniref:hypothetical protein n=1 Tax=Halopiger goleimassiliensis TaxID=1293048 RepID=UPI000677E70C|nr:hypothetical protein [Halopiger goleimassiliensis]
MEHRETAISKTVEYETATCVHCGEAVFVDDDVDNVDDLPEGVTVVVGGGEHMTVERTDRTARVKTYRTPTVLVKWFLGESDGDLLEQHMCRSCADAVYGFAE